MNYSCRSRIGTHFIDLRYLFAIDCPLPVGALKLPSIRLKAKEAEIWRNGLTVSGGTLSAVAKMIGLPSGRVSVKRKGWSILCFAT